MKIVMLDDERISLAVLRNHVAKISDTQGFVFTHPSDALRWCAMNEPDAVIIDFMMHEMDGLEFVERFRLLPGKTDVPILMVTGSPQPELRCRAERAGVHFFPKPLDVVALRACLGELLAKRAGKLNQEPTTSN